MKRTTTLTALLFLLVSLAGCGYATPEPAATRPNTWAQPVGTTDLENFYQVSDELYRSKYPSSKHLQTLRAAGIKTIINLRSSKPDTTETFRQAGITPHWHPMKAGSVTQADLVSVLRLLKNSSKPALIHCRRGADRTGFIIAGYRIVHQGWSKEDAIREMRKGGFGFYEGYDNIIQTLEKLDPAAIRHELATQQ